MSEGLGWDGKRCYTVVVAKGAHVSAVTHIHDSLSRSAETEVAEVVENNRRNGWMVRRVFSDAYNPHQGCRYS